MDDNDNFVCIEETARLQLVKIKHARLATDVSHCFPQDGAFWLLLQLQKLEQESSTFLHALAERDPELANYLRHQSQKLDLLVSALLETEPAPDWSELSIKLSEKFIHLTHADAYKPDQWLALRVILSSGSFAFQCYAKIRRCEAQNSGKAGYQLSAELVWQSEDQQDQLAKHILRHQARLRREQTEASH